MNTSKSGEALEDQVILNAEVGATSFYYETVLNVFIYLFTLVLHIYTIMSYL